MSFDVALSRGRRSPVGRNKRSALRRTGIPGGRIIAAARAARGERAIPQGTGAMRFAYCALRAVFRCRLFTFRSWIAQGAVRFEYSAWGEMRLSDLIGAQNVEHRCPRSYEVIRNYSPMAPPPDGLSTHYCSCFYLP